MRVSYKIILIIWVVLLGAFGTLVYFTYSRLQPETFISLLKTQIEKNYPGSQVQIGEMDYRPALDLSLSFKNIQISRPDRKLGSISELEIRVPWWLLISDRGNAQINVSGLEVFLTRDDEANLTQPSSPKFKDNKVIRVVMPEYLAHAKYTLRAKDIMIRDAQDSRRNFILSKLLVKEFQYGKNSAFELNIPIEVNHNKAKFTSELWLFGDLTPDKELWRLNFRGEFKTRDLTDKSDLEDLAIDGKADFKPAELNLLSTLSFSIEREQVGQGKIVADKDELGMDLNFTAFPLEYLGIFSEELKNPYLPALSGPAAGSVKFHRHLKDDEALNLEAKFSFDGNFPIDPEHIFGGKWQFLFKDSNWQTSFISPRGDVSFFRRSLIDIPKGEVQQYFEEIGFTGIELDPAMAIQMTLPQFRLLQFPHYYSSKISLNGCQQGEAKINGTLFHGTTPHEKFYQVNLNGNGTLKLDYLFKDGIENLKLEANDFQWTRGYRFFDPAFTAESTKMTGKVEGKWEADWTTGIWLTQLKLAALSQPQGKLSTLSQKLWSEYSVDALAATEQNWSASLKAGVMNLTTLTVDSPESAKITGTLSPLTKKSHIILTYPKNKKWKPVRKELPEFTW